MKHLEVPIIAAISMISVAKGEPTDGDAKVIAIINSAARSEQNLACVFEWMVHINYASLNFLMSVLECNGNFAPDTAEVVVLIKEVIDMITVVIEDCTETNEKSGSQSKCKNIILKNNNGLVRALFKVKRLVFRTKNKMECDQSAVVEFAPLITEVLDSIQNCL
ncbi:uncharacterized protein LOC115623095 [Scaptodrosophila lebanonensis]|uniref:Uncharacterized protein LOC115623095 n=1 Tax=Drosophila lebanonensis TaxID=7225 RepID=A0A6J2TDU0_DROLE|nr:uncharacterized protein LOC115623095 [Scaptodrosophila lebanonensis]